MTKFYIFFSLAMSNYMWCFITLRMPIKAKQGFTTCLNHDTKALESILSKSLKPFIKCGCMAY